MQILLVICAGLGRANLEGDFKRKKAAVYFLHELRKGTKRDIRKKLKKLTTISECIIFSSLFCETGPNAGTDQS